jgi:hypothetical protein
MPRISGLTAGDVIERGRCKANTADALEDRLGAEPNQDARTAPRVARIAKGEMQLEWTAKPRGRDPLAIALTASTSAQLPSKNHSWSAALLW